MQNHLKKRDTRRKRRTLSVRRKLRGSSEKPRLSIFRSNRHLQVQIIDDENSVTLVGMSTNGKQFKGSTFAKKSSEAAKEIGKKVAEKAKKKNIEKVVFDRGPYKYHGLVAQLAEAAREAGLKF